MGEVCSCTCCSLKGQWTQATQDSPRSGAAFVKACAKCEYNPFLKSHRKPLALGNVLRNHRITSVREKSVSSSNNVTVSPLIKETEVRTGLTTSSLRSSQPSHFKGCFFDLGRTRKYVFLFSFPHFFFLFILILLACHGTIPNPALLKRLLLL